MTRDKIQKEALEILRLNNYNGTICLSTGTGKSKLSIDAIKEGGFKNILITIPRTNLKNNWEKELHIWGSGWLFDDIHVVVIENIQTCYKWNLDILKQFDLIIADEVHTTASENYGDLIVNAKKLNIPVIGLTATPSLHIEEKDLFYKQHIPIIYEYYGSAKDGIINKRRYFIYSYDLTDNYKVITGTKKKPFLVGEKTQYEYLSKQLRKGQILMSQTGSQDWFRDAANWGWNGQGNSSQKAAAITYLNAIKYRKEFLWNLTSSAEIANGIKNKILNNTVENKNKVLLFSELTTQAEKLSPYSIHSKQDEETNKQLLNHFDSGVIRELSSVRSLTLGLNIKGANWAIIESYNSSPTDITQKMGRTDRLSKDDIANVVIIVPKATQAEEWFRNFSKDIDLSEAVYINSIEQFNLTKLI